MLRRLIGEDITYSTVLASNLGLVRADVGQIEQILLNLATNARDAMPRGGKLTIETRNASLADNYVGHHPGSRVGEHVMIAVADTGTGMDADTQRHLFEPFFTTKEIGRGTGLELAAVYGIVTQSGGSLDVSSEVGQGSTFRAYFSRVYAAAEGASVPEPKREQPRGTETILLVEDERQVRFLARLALQAAGYTVLEAADGESALRAVEEETGAIHLLVTDVVMPGMSGRVVAEHAVSRLPNLRVLYVSAYTDDIVVRHGVIEAGAAFLQKPYTPSTLTQKVRDVLDATRSE